MATTKKSVFETLSAINVNDKVEKKNKLTYLSWAWAWAEVKKAYPSATYKVVKDDDGKPYIFDESLGYMVMTEVTIEEETLEMWLPVMDGANKAMLKEAYTYKGWEWQNGRKTQVDKSVDAASMFDINKTIMRCLTKNLAMFGLGHYIYAGEDLPEQEPMAPEQALKGAPAPANTAKPVQQSSAPVKQDQQTPMASKSTATKKKIVLELNSDNWVKVLKYISANRGKMKFEDIIMQLRGKYLISNEIEQSIKKQCA